MTTHSVCLGNPIDREPGGGGGYILQSCKDLDMTEHLSIHACIDK